MLSRKQLLEKWAPILDEESMPQIKDQFRREITAVMLENQQIDLQQKRAAAGQLDEAAPANSVGSYADSDGFAKFDPVLINLVRRSTPNLIAYDICGVQPMTQPTGLIFAMKSRYTSQAGTEALFNEPNSGFSGTGTHAGANPANGTYTTGTGIATADGEALGDGVGADFGQMAFSIEKVSVTAKTRALKAEYSVELAQDMKSVHGLDAEAELTNILSTEITAETNREVVRNVYVGAKQGAQNGTAVKGTFDLDVDANGRWSVEKFKGLMFQVERDANAIGHTTRRGRGNFVLCSADVASALAMAGVLDYAPALAANGNLNIDDASTTFAGVLNGKYKVFIDPYASNQTDIQTLLIGYKGQSAFDAGLFWCPYTPLQLVRAIDPDTFQPKIAFRTRYGLVTHPMVQVDGTGNQVAGENYYYRKIAVTNLM